MLYFATIRSLPGCFVFATSPFSVGFTFVNTASATVTLQGYWFYTDQDYDNNDPTGTYSNCAALAIMQSTDSAPTGTCRSPSVPYGVSRRYSDRRALPGAASDITY